MAKGYIYNKDLDLYIELNVRSASTGSVTQSTKATLAHRKVMYPRHIFQKEIKLTVQTATLEERKATWGALAQYMIDTSHQYGSPQIVQFVLPTEQWFYDVIITDVPMVRDRFDSAPEFDITMILARNKLETQTINTSHLDSERPYYWDETARAKVSDKRPLVGSIESIQIAIPEILNNLKEFGENIGNWWERQKGAGQVSNFNRMLQGDFEKPPTDFELPSTNDNNASTDQGNS